MVISSDDNSLTRDKAPGLEKLNWLFKLNKNNESYPFLNQQQFTLNLLKNPIADLNTKTIGNLINDNKKAADESNAENERSQNEFKKTVSNITGNISDVFKKQTKQPIETFSNYKKDDDNYPLVAFFLLGLLLLMASYKKKYK